MHFCRILFVAIFVWAVPPGIGQTLSLGAVGGASLTSDFGGKGTTIIPVPSSVATFTTYTSRNTFVIGPKLELAFPGRLSLEINVLHRRRESGGTLVYTPPVTIDSKLVSSYSWRETESVWEVPLLVKYRLPILERTLFTGPFIEAGPSLRPWLYAKGAARAGITGGAGVQLRLGGLKVEPTVRYTRWGTFERSNKPDQVEVLVGLAADSRSLRPSAFGRRLSIGIIGGVGLGGDFPATDGHASFRSKLVGVTLETDVAERTSVEFGALYRPRVLSEAQRATVLTWEFPLLGKYRFSKERLSPFIELGPSFRSSGNLNRTNPSHLGVTVGAGVEIELRGLRISPRLRFTHWARDRGPASAFSLQDQADLLVGFRF